MLIFDSVSHIKTRGLLFEKVFELFITTVLYYEYLKKKEK